MSSEGATNIDDDSLTFTLIGNERDKGQVRLPDLTDCLARLQECIHETERCITNKRPSITYIVRKMSVASPAVAEISAKSPRKGKPDFRSDIFGVARNTMRTFQSGSSRTDPRLDRAAIEKYKAFGEIIQKGAGLSLIVEKTAITHSYLLAAEKALEPEEISHGSISGVMEKIDLHERNVFAIFPPIGGNQVNCYFEDDLLPKVQVALRRTVTVYGKMHYVSNRISPLKVIVDDMEVHPDVDDIPSFKSLAGRLTQVSEDSVSLIRKMRDEWDK